MRRDQWLIGHRRNGDPIYAMAGGDAAPAEYAQRADAALNELEQLTDDLREQLRNTRAPSKARAILGGAKADDDVAIEDRFFLAVAMARSRDAETQQAGKAMLAEMGVGYVGQAPGKAVLGESGKAVLGDTGTTGGYIVPANRVADIVEASKQASPVRDLLDVVEVTLGAGVEIPVEGAVPQRATIVGRGQTKPNENVSLSNYTATMYTLARIIDGANQWLRQSGGRGEQVIRRRLGRAFALGETYYVLEGSGSSEPTGILTAVAAVGATYDTAHTPSDTTVAGSVRAAFAKMIEALARRGRDADAILCNPGIFARAALQGTDEAGFFTDGNLGSIGLPNVKIATSTAVPLATAIAGEWGTTEFYVGEDYRVDSSSEAGDRWDKNLTGFRAELEIGFNALPHVLAGKFQICDSVIST
ncbi:MAG: phage major capsid protein [Chloroflexota bacterium]|nr:phage major capsid protein [Chloroflexota bacterium]